MVHEVVRLILAMDASSVGLLLSVVDAAAARLDILRRDQLLLVLSNYITKLLALIETGDLGGRFSYLLLVRRSTCLNKVSGAASGVCGSSKLVLPLLLCSSTTRGLSEDKMAVLGFLKNA